MKMLHHQQATLAVLSTFLFFNASGAAAAATSSPSFAKEGPNILLSSQQNYDEDDVRFHFEQENENPSIRGANPFDFGSCCAQPPDYFACCDFPEYKMFKLIINLDTQPEETSWTLENTITQEVIRNETFVESEANSTRIYNFCVQDGAIAEERDYRKYRFVYKDGAGDGLVKVDSELWLAGGGNIYQEHMLYTNSSNKADKFHWYWSVTHPCTQSPTRSPSLLPTAFVFGDADESVNPTAGPTNKSGATRSLSFSFAWTTCLSCCIVVFLLMVTG